MVDYTVVLKLFPELKEQQILAISQLGNLYAAENEKVNLISRKDLDMFYIHHVLHSLALAKYYTFLPGQKVIDIGTGGGFPGIPLAILFPDTEFLLCDSIGKKIKAVENIADTLGLENAIVLNARTEDLKLKFDIALARAVAPMTKLWQWMIGNWKNRAHFILLKGGDLSEEMNELLVLNNKIQIKSTNISTYFSDPYFETKKIIEIK